MFKVEINNIKVKSKIGVSALERKKNQLLIVSISFNYKVKPKLDINDIKNLKDYSLITKFLKKFIEKSKYKTLEKLIIESKKALNKKFVVQSIYLKIEKPEVAKKYKCNSISVSE